MIGEIHNAHGERIDYTWRAVENEARGLVVIGHGVTANKDRPWLVALSDALHDNGIPSLRLSFSGNGESGGRFEDSTITKEVEDLGVVLDAVFAANNESVVAYAGHSMGGAVGVLRAAEDPRIHAMVSMAGMVYTAEFAERKFGDLSPGSDCMWGKPECPLSAAFVEDLTAIGSVISLGASISIPWLLVHGTADEVVLPKDSHDIRAAAEGRPELIELAGADHVFSGAETEAMSAAVVAWLVRVLG